MSTIYERNYQLLTELIDIDQLKRKGYLKYKTNGYMDLNVDYLRNDTANGTDVIALAHNFIQNGDVMKDPDMEIRVYESPDYNYIEALTFEDTLTPYQQVYTEKNNQKLVRPKLKQQLNSFLNQWLRNLKAQGFKLY